MAYGKIARLPREIRERLNHRLQDSEPASGLVDWLNSLPEVKKMLKAQFAGRAITEQNVSEWKQYGHQDWLRQQEAMEWVEKLGEQSDELEDQFAGVEISDRFGVILAAEMTRLAKVLLDQEVEPEKRWQRLREVAQTLSQLRRDDYRTVLSVIARERWERETRQAEEQEQAEKIMAPLSAHLHLAMLDESMASLGRAKKNPTAGSPGSSPVSQG